MKKVLVLMAIVLGVTNMFAQEAVDLGLSVKWATFNIDAYRPFMEGGKYAWGETKTKENYSWYNYKYSEWSESTLTKYCSDKQYGYQNYTDNKRILDLTDDVAHVKWGGSWRIPTQEEYYELRSKCIWDYTSMNGINGYEIKSKVPGYTDNSIFIPIGNYWISSCYNSSALYFSIQNNYYSDYSIYRYYGFFIRPVCK